VEHARHALRIRHVEDVAQAADVDLVEILAPRPPDADERRGVDDRVAAACRALERRAISDVAVDRASRQAAHARVSRKDDDLVPARGQRRNEGPAEIAGSARHENVHGCARQYSSRSSSVCSSGIAGVQPSSSCRR
jgi:hypothetical protein